MVFFREFHLFLPSFVKSKIRSSAKWNCMRFNQIEYSFQLSVRFQVDFRKILTTTYGMRKTFPYSMHTLATAHKYSWIAFFLTSVTWTTREVSHGSYLIFQPSLQLFYVVWHFFLTYIIHSHETPNLPQILAVHFRTRMSSQTICAKILNILITD